MTEDCHNGVCCRFLVRASQESTVKVQVVIAQQTRGYCAVRPLYHEPEAAHWHIGDVYLQDAAVLPSLTFGVRFMSGDGDSRCDIGPLTFPSVGPAVTLVVAVRWDQKQPVFIIYPKKSRKYREEVEGLLIHEDLECWGGPQGEAPFMVFHPSNETQPRSKLFMVGVQVVGSCWAFAAWMRFDTAYIFTTGVEDEDRSEERILQSCSVPAIHDSKAVFFLKLISREVGTAGETVVLLQNKLTTLPDTFYEGVALRRTMVAEYYSGSFIEYFTYGEDDGLTSLAIKRYPGQHPEYIDKDGQAQWLYYCSKWHDVRDGQTPKPKMSRNLASILKLCGACALLNRRGEETVESPECSFKKKEVRYYSRLMPGWPQPEVEVSRCEESSSYDLSTNDESVY